MVYKGAGRSFDSPMYSGDLQPLKCECIKKGNGEVMCISNMEEGHLDIMVTSLEINLCLHNIRMSKMMRYYTNDMNVLEMATIAEKLYDREDASGEKYVKDHITTMRRLLRKLKHLRKASNE